MAIKLTAESIRNNLFDLEFRSIQIDFGESGYVDMVGLDECGNAGQFASSGVNAQAINILAVETEGVGWFVRLEIVPPRKILTKIGSG